MSLVLCRREEILHLKHTWYSGSLCRLGEKFDSKRFSFVLGIREVLISKMLKERRGNLC